MTKRFGLPKSSRLKSRKQIDTLFANGKSFLVFPIRVTYQWLPAANGGSLQAGVTASKRNFKKAVDRNRIKRLLREAYRLQKEELQNTVAASGKSGAVFFLYAGKTLPSFTETREAMAKCLKKLHSIITSEGAA